MKVPRGLGLLLLAYVFLDIANPMMPGAVQFVAATIQGALAQRARPPADMPVLSALSLSLLALAPQPLRRPPRPRSPSSPSRRAVARRPRAPVPKTSASSAPDDH
jgi:hypothetical protein